MAKPVAIIMGSQSDWPTLKHASETLDELGVGHEALIVSAHRTPEEAGGYARDAEGKGIKVLICGAGLAAHLAGAIVAQTTLPRNHYSLLATIESLWNLPCLGQTCSLGASDLMTDLFGIEGSSAR